MDKPVRKLAVDDDKGFPTVAIVVIAVGGYLFIFFIILLIRKICLSKGNDICPSWCAEDCLCNSCSDNEESDRCAIFCTDHCNCLSYPNKRSFMDAVCPSKAWCDEVFCCCLSQEPEGKCSACNCCKDSCCNVGEPSCCTGCKQYCQGFKCECCAQPETLNCCCIEIKLAGATERALANSRNNGYNNQGYMNQGYAGQQPPYNQPGVFEQPGYMQQPGIQQQPGFSQRGRYGNQPPINQQYGGHSLGQSSSNQFGGHSLGQSSSNQLGGHSIDNSTSSHLFGRSLMEPAPSESRPDVFSARPVKRPDLGEVGPFPPENIDSHWPVDSK